MEKRQRFGVGPGFGQIEDKFIDQRGRHSLAVRVVFECRHSLWCWAPQNAQCLIDSRIKFYIQRIRPQAFLENLQRLFGIIFQLQQCAAQAGM